MDDVQTVAGTLGSVDEFSSVLAQSGWSLDFRQLNRGRSEVKLRGVSNSSLLLLEVAFDGRVHQRALPPPGYLTFGLPTGEQAPGRIGRRALSSESLNFFDPTQGFDAVSAPGFSAYTLSFSTERLARTAQLLGLPNPADNPGFGERQKLPYAEDVSSLRRIAATYLCAAQQYQGQAAQNLSQELESELCQLLLRAWHGAQPSRYEPVTNRSRLLKRAMAYINSRPAEVFSVEELCHASASSMSTLERAFREHYGVSPKHYLTAVRLCGVRRSLLDAQFRQIRIGDIATQWGFWHMSKFAADYKKMFGELPSATRQGS